MDSATAVGKAVGKVNLATARHICRTTKQADHPAVHTTYLTSPCRAVHVAPQQHKHFSVIILDPASHLLAVSPNADRVLKWMDSDLPLRSASLRIPMAH